MPTAAAVRSLVTSHGARPATAAGARGGGCCERPRGARVCPERRTKTSHPPKLATGPVGTTAVWCFGRMPSSSLDPGADTWLQEVAGRPRTCPLSTSELWAARLFPRPTGRDGAPCAAPGPGRGVCPACPSRAGGSACLWGRGPQRSTSSRALAAGIFSSGAQSGIGTQAAHLSGVTVAPTGLSTRVLPESHRSLN